MKPTTIKYGIEKNIKKYQEIVGTANNFLKERDLSPFNFAVLSVANKLGKFKINDMVSVFSGGLNVFGRTYTPGETTMPSKLSMLRKKGYLDLSDKIFTLSPFGKTFLFDFTKLMNSKLQKKKEPQLKTTLKEKLTPILTNDLHFEIQCVAEAYPDKKSIYLDFLELEKKDPDVTDALREDPDGFISVVTKIIGDMNIVIPLNSKEKKFRPHIRVRNLPPEYSCVIKNITSFYVQHISPLFQFEGVITSKGDILHKPSIAHFICNKCNEEHNEPQLTRYLVEPLSCKNCRRRKEFRLVEGKSQWVDVQILEIQEAFESLEMGEQVRSIPLWVEDDLCDAVEIGEPVRITGISRLIPPKKKDGLYTRVIDVLSVVKTEERLDVYNLTEDDEAEIIKLGKDPQVFHRIRDSIAPSIYGYDVVKEALSLQLFGGRPDKKNPDGIPERSLIHILLIGEPGTGKSRLTQLVARLAPKHILASGKGASGCGLTATVVKDELGGDRWIVKAGAMLLANGGFLVVDEFDKMSPSDQVSMNSGMESQVIPITKAGIVAQYKSDTIVLAAANPKFSRFDKYKPILEQFNLDESLLSRFDLVFPFMDVSDPESDRMIAERIIQSHSNIPDEPKEKDPWFIPSDTLRKYIAFAKQNYSPVLSPEAMKKLVEAYLALRQNTESRMVTPRQLGGLIRLAEASAKQRLSNDVHLDDVNRAVRIYTTALQDIATDPSTGEVDIDRIYTTHPASQREKIVRIEQILRDNSNETEAVSIATVLTKAQEQGIPGDECRKIISELKNKSIIFP